MHADDVLPRRESTLTFCSLCCAVLCCAVLRAGTPSDEDLGFVKSSRAMAFMKKQAGKPKVPFATLFKGANPQACYAVV